MRNRFEECLEQTPENGQYRNAIINTADTMLISKRWFETYGVAYTARDLLKFTELVQAEQTKLYLSHIQQENG